MSASQSPSNPSLTEQVTSDRERPRGPTRLRLYSHSPILYWWPVWLCGFIMAALTYQQGTIIQIGQTNTHFHENSKLGLIFFVVLFLVILVTNFEVRGLASGIVILTLLLAFVLLLYFNVWEKFAGWFISHNIYMNAPAYLWFSTVLFAMWAIVVFGLDRMTYWEIEPGQLTQGSIFGAGSRSFNTQGMMLEKHQDDVFRHWLLGLGSGDIQVMTSGATRERLDIRNVLFIRSKIIAMQRLIAEVPEE